MKRTLKLLGGIVTVVAILALAAPASHAQCAQTRNFGGLGGKAGATVVVDASAFANNNNELAQFWETGNPGNGTGVGAASTCPSQGVAGVANPWWGIHAPTGNRVVNGIASAAGCLLPVCPGAGTSLSFLIEDRTLDGSGSGFIMYTVDETPAANNWYDIGRTDPMGGAGTLLVHVMGSLPAVTVTGSNGPPPTTTTTNDYPDVGILFHGVTGAANTPLPASAQITSYDVLSFNGLDPGRDRSLWSAVQSIPYTDAAIIADSVAVPCPSPVDTVLAIGITFDGGIQSTNVGPASVPIACDPNLAEPDVPKVRRPSFKRQPVGRKGR